MELISGPSRFTSEQKARAVRMVLEGQSEYSSQWSAIESVAAKVGISSETLRKWVRRVEVDGGQRPGLTSDEAAEITRLKREVAELRRANEILKAGGCRMNRRRVTAIRWPGAGLLTEKIIAWPTTLWQPTATS